MIDVSKSLPYLSIVICSRNDDHGGNMLQRMQTAFSGLLTQLEKYRIESELILVDWNPPKGKPLLKDVITRPNNLDFCTIRYIVVPSFIHRRYKHHKKLPLHATVAVNTGIRRARGLFILPGVIDLLYSNELMSYIAGKKLNPNIRYRVDRYDVDKNILKYKTIEEQLEFANRNITRIYSHTNKDKQTFHPKLHEWACGDFQLMARRHWLFFRGYREEDILAPYVDGLLSYASYAAGIKELVLNDPMRIYHINHRRDRFDKSGLDKSSLHEKLRSSKLAKWIYRQAKTLILRRRDNATQFINGIPALSYSGYQNICKDMLNGKRQYIFNDEKWGLGKEKLKETVLSRARWDSAADTA